MTSTIHNAVVIGGGPAGAAVAISLARLNKPVCLLERKAGPHDKVCGEFISWEAAHYLQQLGINLSALGAQQIRRFNLCSGEQLVSTRLPFTGWSLSRRCLDDALLLQAASAGVNVRTGIAVRKLQRAEHGWNLHAAHGYASEPAAHSDTNTELMRGRSSKKNTTKTDELLLQTPTVFLASGKHDIRGWCRPRPSASNNFIGLKMHLMLAPAQQNLLRETVEIHLFNGGYAGLEPIEHDKVNLCFLINRNIFHNCDKHWPRVLEWLGTTSSHLRQRLLGSTPLWPQPLAISGVPYGFIHSPSAVEPDLFCLGDQAAVIPSFAGDGIAMALHSAVLAARVYADGGDAARYHHQLQRNLQQPIYNAQRLAALFSSAAGRKAALILGRWCPSLITAAVARTRINSSLLT